MNARPAGISDDDVRAALSETWRIDAASLVYAPVGAGSYHWIATDRTGTRLFITVDDLGAKPWLGGDFESVFTLLQRCYESAWRLRHESGLEFIVAPVRGGGGTICERLSARHTLAVLPYVEGQDLGDFDTPPEATAEIVTLLARLHSAGDTVKDLAPVRRFEIPDRAELEAALSELNEPWPGGPHAEAARAWLAANADAVTRGLRAYDALANQISARSNPVITHGEPHAGNFIRVDGALALVDWDTLAFAPPERDLWLCSRHGTKAAELYERATGRAVDPGSIHLFTIGWELTDVALYLGYLRAKTVESEDTRFALWVLGHIDLAALA